MTSQKFGSPDFCRIANSVSNKGKSTIPPIFNRGVALCISQSKIIWVKTFLIPKMFKKVIMNLDLSKVSGPDCIPEVVLKNCEPELSYILAELFNKFLKESCFPDFQKVLSVVPVFENVEKGLQLKTMSC